MDMPFNEMVKSGVSLSPPMKTNIIKTAMFCSSCSPKLIWLALHRPKTVAADQRRGKTWAPDRSTSCAATRGRRRGKPKRWQTCRPSLTRSTPQQWIKKASRSLSPTTTFTPRPPTTTKQVTVGSCRGFVTSCFATWLTPAGKYVTGQRLGWETYSPTWVVRLGTLGF